MLPWEGEYDEFEVYGDDYEEDPNGGVSARSSNRQSRRRREQPSGDGPCPQCGGSMKLRTNRTTGNQFYGCCRYPECTGTRNV